MEMPGSGSVIRGAGCHRLLKVLFLYLLIAICTEEVARHEISHSSVCVHVSARFRFVCEVAYLGCY